MGGHWSSEVGRSSRIEESNSSRVESPRRIRDFIRDRANSSKEESHISHRPDACDDEQKKYEQKKLEAIEMGRNKMEKYQQQAKLYQNEDRDTFEQFKEDFESTISIESANRAVYIISRKPDYAMSISEIDVINGKITGEIYDHQKSRENRNEFNLSEIAFNQIRLAMEDLKREMPEFNLKCWYDVCVVNKETKEIVKLFFPEERGPYGKIKADRKTFKAGEDEFIALAGTSTGQSKFYLLAQHPKAFPGKEVTSITVIRHSGGSIDIEYEFGSQWEQKEEASPNTSNTAVFGSRDSLE